MTTTLATWLDSRAGRFRGCREARHRDAAHHLCLNGVDDQNVDVRGHLRVKEAELALR